MELTALDTIILLVSVALGAVAMPLGLLPAVLIYRSLANGANASAKEKRNYRIATVVGLLSAWALGTVAVLFVLRWLLLG